MTSQVKQTIDQWGKWKYEQYEIKKKNLRLKVQRWLLLGRGLLQKTSEPEQIVVEDLVTSFLQILVTFCNRRFFRSCQYSLQMDEDGNCKQTRCIVK